ncbi:hypothetical protein D1BOALGB6SA_2461 [Olavius sp. associated proteobacterium Delta 1]|nr:hypothetical protein D1BOALGB6SA_2461 [Olavius sp. associated proteobacterium Delta 1]
MQYNNNITTSKQRVLIFPAQTPKVSSRQIYFLFSQRQMEDILLNAPVQRVPFSPSYIEGLAEWRNQVLPVISLESCLGIESLNSSKVQRLMVVRAAKNEAATTNFYRIMLRVVPPIQMLELPLECSPVSDGWIPEKSFAQGVYEWANGFLVVAHIKNILTGGN